MIVYKQYTERKQIFQLGKAYSNNIRWDNIFFPPKFRKNLNHRKHISVATLLKCPAVARQQILNVFTFKHYLDGLAKNLFWGLYNMNTYYWPSVWIFILCNGLWVVYGPNTLLEKFWRIPLYLTDDAIAKLYVTQSFVN